MALERLTKAKIEKAKPPAKLSDGGGLVLRLHKDGRRYWLLRYQPHFSLGRKKTPKELGVDFRANLTQRFHPNLTHPIVA